MTTENTEKSARAFDVEKAAEALLEVADVKAIDRELKERGLVLSKDLTPKDRAFHLLKADGVATQGHFAAWVINLTHGEGKDIDPDTLTASLQRAFPHANIGKRHGPHYLTHARKGRLKGLREGLPPIPFTRRAAAQQAEASETKSEGVSAEALMADNDRKTLQEMAKGLNLSASGKTEEIAQRIADHMNTNPAKGEDEQKVANA